ncbi:MAG: hypothetical protein PS018_18365 [bacterium]|nr:hypothetical protein [bacterium]
MTWQPTMPERVVAKAGAARGFHDALATSSEKFLYSHVRNEAFVALAVKHNEAGRATRSTA